MWLLCVYLGLPIFSVGEFFIILQLVSTLADKKVRAIILLLIVMREGPHLRIISLTHTVVFTSSCGKMRYIIAKLVELIYSTTSHITKY